MLNLGKLIYDSTKSERIPAEYAKYSQSERENAIREKIFEVLGVTEYEKKSFRKAMRRHSVEVYEIIEEVIDNVLSSSFHLCVAFGLREPRRPISQRRRPLGEDHCLRQRERRELSRQAFRAWSPRGVLCPYPSGWFAREW